MTPTERKIYAALAANPKGLTGAELVDLVYGDDPNGGPDSAIAVVRVLLSSLRRKVRGKAIACMPGSKRYAMFAPGFPPPVEPGDVLSRRQRAIYDIIVRRPGTGQARIAEITGMSSHLVGAHIWRINGKIARFGIRLCAAAPRQGYKIVKIERRDGAQAA